MGSSIKIKSTSIDLADTANKIDMVKCDHFSIRGFVAEVRERDQRKCWPFSRESVNLVDQQSYSLPSLSVPKFRWWHCMSCIKDIDADHGTTKDCGLHSNSRTISQSKLKSVTCTNIAGNVIEENENVNYERSGKDGQTGIVFCGQENETVYMKWNTNFIKHSAATKFLKKVHPQSMDASTVKSKSRKFASPEQISNKRCKVNNSSMDISIWKRKQIADKATTKNQKGISLLLECNNGSSESAMNELQGRKSRKVRLLSELLSKPNNKTSGGGSNIRKEESGLNKESVRGRKRKLLPENNYVRRVCATSENASRSCDSDGESTDSGFDRTPIKGKQRNRRFQVVDEFVQSLPCDASQKGIEVHDADPSNRSTAVHSEDLVLSPPSTQRTERKLSLAKKKTKKPVLDNGKSTLISFDSSIDGNQTKFSTVEWLRSGVDAVNFNNSNNNSCRPLSSNFKLIQIPSSTEVTDLSLVLQKDASDVDRKRKTIIVQEHHGAPRSESHDIKGNMTEEQNDDIPMEIVELMAKNQYERCLPDKEEVHKPKNALLIDLNETYDNGISLEDNNISRPPKPCGSNARREEHCPMGKQQNSHDFFPISQPYAQENEASSIGFSGHNSEWLRNLPTMANQNPSPSSFRVLRACDTCQSVPIQYKEASHPIWPSSMIPPQSHHKPTNAGMLSQASNNEHKWNLNFVAANGNPNPNSKSSFGCKHDTAGVSTSQQPIDTFSSESFIPAMHLLSLMDPRLRSNTTADQHVSKTAYSTSQLPFDSNNKRFAHETSKNCFPIIPHLGTSSFSLQNVQASWGPHQDKNTMRKDSVAPVYSTHEKTVSARSNDQEKFQLLGASNSMMLPLKFHIKNKEKKQKRRAEFCNNVSTKPVKNSSGPILCNINRNPADFTIPEPGNVYMLTGEHLKVRKSTIFRKKSSLCKQDELKQTKKQVCPATENV